MASKTSLNAKNLEALGAERLSELLIEVSTGDAAMKRRLRLELAGSASPAEAAREIGKRLATISRSRSFVDWRTREALVKDLDTQRRTIVEKVAPRGPIRGARPDVALLFVGGVGSRAVRRLERYRDWPLRGRLRRAASARSIPHLMDKYLMPK